MEVEIWKTATEGAVEAECGLEVSKSQQRDLPHGLPS